MKRVILTLLNHFPSDVNFQTFLLDSQNKVLAIGNPVHNKKVRDLYLQIIAGQQTGVATSSQTKVVFDKKLDEMGDFDWKIPQTATFSLRNLGDHLLIIEDINANMAVHPSLTARSLYLQGSIPIFRLLTVQNIPNILRRPLLYIVILPPLQYV